MTSQNWQQQSGLLSVQERLSENLSGSQIYNIMLSMLYPAVDAIAVNTTIVRRALVEVLCQWNNDKRRHVSSLSYQQVVDGLFNAVMVENPYASSSYARRLRLDRSIWGQVVRLFLTYSEDYAKLEIPYITDRRIGIVLTRYERFFEASRSRLFPTIKWVKYYWEEYETFKSEVTEKYIRFSFSEAKRAATMTALHVDVEELFKNLLLAVDKALNKYDPNKGALTSYIQQWFMDAKTNPDFSHIYGEAYSLSDEARRNLLTKSSANNFAYELGDDHEEDNADTGCSALEDLMLREDMKIARDSLPYIENSMLAILYTGLADMCFNKQQDQETVNDTQNS